MSTIKTNQERQTMKNIRFLTFVLIVGTLVLSACGAATATPDAATSVNAEAMPLTFVGIVDSIAGDQWVISGNTVTVDASIVRDGPFNVGDRIKVEGLVNPDGSFTVSRVEAPTPQEAATLPPVSVDNSNDAATNTNDSNVNDTNINDGNINDDNSNDSNVNDDNGSGNTNDDNSNSSNDNSDDSGSGNDNGDDNGGNDNGDDNGANDNGDDSGGDSSNDDKGDDDNSGKDGGDDKGGDDNGGNSNDD
jgi:hypothetical protein